VDHRRRELGQAGEEAACRYLMALGWQVLARNWRCPHGEVDIIARDGSALVFCEVRTRGQCRFGGPLESITASKAARMRLLAGAWLAHFGPFPGELRIDVVGIARTGAAGWELTHLQGVLS
jgi:putative endonuclease